MKLLFINLAFLALLGLCAFSVESAPQEDRSEVFRGGRKFFDSQKKSKRKVIVIVDDDGEEDPQDYVTHRREQPVVVNTRILLSRNRDPVQGQCVDRPQEKPKRALELWWPTALNVLT